MRAIAYGEAPPMAGGGVRRPAGGRPSFLVKQPGRMAAVNALVESTTRGDPERALLWTTRNVRRLCAKWENAGFQVGRQVITELLKSTG